MAVINIRGTNGSGKSTVVRRFMERYGARPVYGVLGATRPEAYRVEVSSAGTTWVLGPYQTLSRTGVEWLVQKCGMAGYLELLERYAARGSFLFEGMLVSGHIGRTGAFLERRRAVVAFLDTPLEECVRRIEGRRLAAGDTRPFDPRNVESKYREVQGARRRFEERGEVRTVDLPGADVDGAVDKISTLLQEA